DRTRRTCRAIRHCPRWCSWSAARGRFRSTPRRSAPMRRARACRARRDCPSRARPARTRRAPARRRRQGTSTGHSRSIRLLLRDPKGFHHAPLPALRGPRAMKRRPLGRSGIEVAPLAFGANVFGWTVDEPTAFLLLDAFVDHGFNLVDTADVYSKWAPGNSGGESEAMLGRWIERSGKRDRVVVATKVGMEMPGVGKGLSARYIRQACEASLRRLRVERIDLYQAHAEDPDTPIDETLEAFDRLVREGKVRAIGASNYSATGLSAALEAS